MLSGLAASVNCKILINYFLRPTSCLTTRKATEMNAAPLSWEGKVPESLCAFRAKGLPLKRKVEAFIECYHRVTPVHLKIMPSNEKLDPIPQQQRSISRLWKLGVQGLLFSSAATAPTLKQLPCTQAALTEPYLNTATGNVHGGNEGLHNLPSGTSPRTNTGAGHYVY